MYAVIIKKPDAGYLPTVVNQNSSYYPDFMMQNYTVLYEGTAKECEAVADEIIQDFLFD